MGLRPGLRSDEPFAITPDPRFAFESSSFLSAFLALVGGIEQRAGLMVLIGAAGCGKTMLLRAIQDTLVQRRAIVFFRFQPYATFDDLLDSLLTELGISPVPETRPERLNALSAQLESRPSPAALLVDEAHCFADSALADFAELAAWRIGTPGGLQVLLAGRPELEEKLKRPALAKVAARVSTMAHVAPLTPDELGRYVAHRIAVAQRHLGHLRSNAAPSHPFAPTALDQVFRYSQGVPRIVNRLCGRALADGPVRIGLTRIEEAAVECRLAQPSAEWAAHAKAREGQGFSAAHAPPLRARRSTGYVVAALTTAALFGIGAASLIGSAGNPGSRDVKPRSPTTVALGLGRVQVAWTDLMDAEAGQLRAANRVTFDSEPPMQSEPPPAPDPVPTIDATPMMPEEIAAPAGADDAAPGDIGTSDPSDNDISASEPPSGMPDEAAPSAPVDTVEAVDVVEPEMPSPEPTPDLALQPDPGGDASRSALAAPPPPNAALVALPQVPMPGSEMSADVPPPQPAAEAPAPPAPALDSERLVARGRALLQSGDPASARLFFERAAAQGHVGAMAAMGQSFDPIELNRLGVIGISGDPGLALDWYRRAAESGDQPSRERMARLTAWMNRRQGQR